MLKPFYVRTIEVEKGMLTTSKNGYICVIDKVKIINDSEVQIDLNTGDVIFVETFYQNQLIYVATLMDENLNYDGLNKVNTKFKRFMFEGKRGIVQINGFVQWATLSCHYLALKGELLKLVDELLKDYHMILIEK